MSLKATRKNIIRKLSTLIRRRPHLLADDANALDYDGKDKMMRKMAKGLLWAHIFSIQLSNAFNISFLLVLFVRFSSIQPFCIVNDAVVRLGPRSCFKSSIFISTWPCRVRCCSQTLRPRGRNSGHGIRGRTARVHPVFWVLKKTCKCASESLLNLSCCKFDKAEPRIMMNIERWKKFSIYLNLLITLVMSWYSIRTALPMWQPTYLRRTSYGCSGNDTNACWNSQSQEFKTDRRRILEGVLASNWHYRDVRIVATWKGKELVSLSKHRIAWGGRHRRSKGIPEGGEDRAQ